MMRRSLSPLSSPFLGLVTVVIASLLISAFTSHYSASVAAQSTATITGRLLDPHGAIVRGAKITTRNVATNIERVGETDEVTNTRFPTGSPARRDNCNSL